MEGGSYSNRGTHNKTTPKGAFIRKGAKSNHYDRLINTKHHAKTTVCEFFTSC